MLRYRKKFFSTNKAEGVGKTAIPVSKGQGSRGGQRFEIKKSVFKMKLLVFSKLYVSI